jgi:hypothetical protein
MENRTTTHFLISYYTKCVTLDTSLGSAISHAFIMIKIDFLILIILDVPLFINIIIILLWFVCYC